MRVVSEISLQDFGFWSGAKNLAEKLTSEEFAIVEDMMEGSFDDWSETAINDLFWFEGDTIAEWLGYESEEEILEREEED